MDHEKVNRSLATVALVLAIILMLGAIVTYYRLQSAAQSFADFTPPPMTEIEECNMAPDTIWDGEACVPLEDFTP